MAKSFLEKFNKYSPAYLEKNACGKIVSYTVKLDQAARKIWCDVSFSDYVSFAVIKSMEEEIK